MSFLNIKEILDSITANPYTSLNILSCLLIVYDSLKKSNEKIEVYKLQRQLDFKPVIVKEAIINREVNAENTELDELNINKEFLQILINFIDIFYSRFKHVNKANFVNNLDKLIIEKKSFINFVKIKYNSNDGIDPNTLGYFNWRNNSISIISRNNKKLETILFHELLHMASTNIDTKNVILNIGFSHDRKDVSIGNGLNEGYTQLLTNKMLNSIIIDSYHFEQAIAFLLEMIVGEKEMEKLYFDGNLYGLIQELKNYQSEKDIIKFLQNLDFYTNVLSKNNKYEQAAPLVIGVIDEIYSFILDCFIKKVLKFEDEDVIYIIEDYISVLKTKIKIGNIKYALNNDVIKKVLIDNNLESLSDKYGTIR